MTNQMKEKLRHRINMIFEINGEQNNLKVKIKSDRIDPKISQKISRD
jgi:hypothetical protein